MSTDSSKVPEPLFTETLQIGIVVRDLDAAMRTYVYEYGIGPWEIFEMNPGTVQDMTKDDQPAPHAMRVALTMVGGTQWELIQPLDENNIYAEFLAAHGEGLHHVGVGVRDYGQAMKALRAKGCTALQGGVLKGVAYTYPSTERDLGFITEIFDFPADFKLVPDAVYPPPATGSSSSS